MIIGVTASQPLPHRWRGTISTNGSGGMAGLLRFGLANSSARFAGSGSLASNAINPLVRATFSGAGATTVGSRLRLSASEISSGAGSIVVFGTISHPPTTFDGQISLAGTGALVATPVSLAFMAFAARCTSAGSTLTGADAVNYRILLDGLTADGLINGDGTSNFFDALYVFAAPDSVVARLNLVSSSFNLTANGSPSFTAYQGYTGIDGSTTVYLATGFIPSTAAGNFTQNSAHASVWSNTNVTGGSGGGTAIGSTGPSSGTNLFPRYSDGNSYWRLNDSTLSGGVIVGTAQGFYLASRSGASAQKGYHNAVDKGMTSVTSGALSNTQMVILAWNNNGSITQGFLGQLSAASFGANLSSTQVTALYNRLATYRTAVGL